jgi:hypothetical protein
MREFRDNEGRPWQVALTVASALRVRDTVTVDVDAEESQPDGGTKLVRRTVPFDLVDVATIHQTLTVLRTQFGKLGEVLYAIVFRQVDARGLTRDDFLDGLRGESLEHAAKALEAEVVDFFPLGLRQIVAKMAEKFDELSARVMTQAVEQMETLNVESLSGTPFGKPPESSASTPANGPTDNSPPQAPPA